MKHEDQYYLFYSGNIDQFYAVGVRQRAGNAEVGPRVFTN